MPNVNQVPTHVLSIRPNKVSLNAIFYFYFKRFHLQKRAIAKVPILKECHFGNSGGLNTFGHFLPSLLGVIAIVFSNHAQK
jgi:hypothetical protein